MDNTVSILDNVPVGFRFLPTDEELVDYYLKHKLLHDDFPVHIIPDIELCKVEPWDVPAKSVIRSHDPEWFFFSAIDYKYSNSKRFNRKTEHGFWKATGKDRTIKRKSTGSVIGTKKTLVFYEVIDNPRGNVKSNWVIHEYHSATFHQSQTNFVLCRLMKKTQQISGRQTDAHICDEGEPSRLYGEDMGTLFWTTEEEAAAYMLPLQSPNRIKEAHSPNHSLLNAYSGNENNIQTSFKTTEEEDEFMESLFAVDAFINEERRDACVCSTRFESLSRVHNESSDTDAEAVSSLHAYPVDTSCDSAPDKFLETSGSEISGSPSILRRCKTKYHREPDNFMSQRSVARRSQTLRNVSTNAASHIKVELPVVESQKDQKKAQNSSSRENLETRSRQSSDVNRKGSFIIMETPSSSQNLFPRSVYLVNVVTGILLLIAISWEVI